MKEKIFYEAKRKGTYSCFLKPETRLPMMYMPDAIRATIELMQAPAENIKIRSAYNVAGMSFDSKEIAAEIKKHIPNFSIGYSVDFRQQIADSWPKSINDDEARKNWGWKHQFDLATMTSDILINLKKVSLSPKP